MPPRFSKVRHPGVVFSFNWGMVEFITHGVCEKSAGI